MSSISRNKFICKKCSNPFLNCKCISICEGKFNKEDILMSFMDFGGLSMKKVEKERRKYFNDNYDKPTKKKIKFVVKKEEEEGIPMEHTSAIRQVNKQIRGEDKCDNCGCESDDEYSVSDSGCDNIACSVEEEDSDTDCTYILRLERAVYGGKHGAMIGMDTAVERDYATLQEAREAYKSYEVEDYGELLYLDMISGEDGEQENLECRGSIEEKIKQEKKDTGFGTEYHDGSGFGDCDTDNTGYRPCKEYDMDKWCSECIYLNS